MQVIESQIYGVARYIVCTIMQFALHLYRLIVCPASRDVGVHIGRNVEHRQGYSLRDWTALDAILNARCDQFGAMPVFSLPNCFRPDQTKGANVRGLKKVGCEEEDRSCITAIAIC